MRGADLCRSRDDHRFRCGEGCDFDVCGSCWSQRVTDAAAPAAAPAAAATADPKLALEEGMLSDHPHALKNQHGGGGYSCGACALYTVCIRGR